MLSCILFVFGALVGKCICCYSTFFVKFKYLSEYAIILFEKQTKVHEKKKKPAPYDFQESRLFANLKINLKCLPQMKRFDSLNESRQSVFLDKKDSPGGRCMVDVPMLASKRFQTIVNLVSCCMFLFILELNSRNKRLSDTIFW